MSEHGNTGNKNASKGGLDSFLHIRVSTKDKALWVQKARMHGKKLSEFVTDTLNKADFYDIEE